MQGDERTKAAGALGGLATNLAGIGISEAGIGAGLEGTSANIGLTKEQQDYQQQEAMLNMFGNIGSGIGKVIGGLI